MPPSVIRTHDPTRPTRIIFGSCRVCAPHEPPHSLRKDDHPDGREVDALKALVQRMAKQEPAEWPEALILLGDQVYADEVSPGVRDFIRSRRDPEVPPGETVADFEEYTRLYWESWGEPYMRWLLSTVPSSMIFDDHDVHDDWNTSKTWVTDIRAQGWWDERIFGGFMSLLALPAPRQPVAARARRPRPLRARARGRGRRRHPARLRVQGRPRGRGHALELLPRHRAGAARDGRLARRPGARPGRAQHGRRGGVGVDRGARARRLQAPADRDLAAAAAGAGDAPPRGVERGDLRRRVGPGRRALRREAAPGRSTSSTGRRSASRSSA